MNSENVLENITMFDDYSDISKYSNKLDVVKLKFESVEPMTWQDMFSGFDNLYAITFSSGINFIYSLLDLFEEAEVIFGCETVLSYTLQEILAYQSKVIERIRNSSATAKEKLFRRMDDEKVKFYVSHEQISHEKIYLLEAKDGRKRVITGSANMSYNAFSGVQRENICCIDDERAFNWYKELFDELKEKSTDDITKRAIELSNLTDNIDELPISASVKTAKAMAIETIKDQKEDVQYVLDVHNIAKTLSPIMPKETKKEGKILIVPEHITKVRGQRVKEEVRERELRSEYPQLNIDVENNTVNLNGTEVNLHPTDEEISNDVNLFIKYMKGYEKFHGDNTGMQYRYFEFANWFFCSPFMAIMRDMAARYDQNRLPYPVFGLVYGQSKAGKTSFLETLLKMMIGQKPKISAPDFTRSSIEGLKRTVHGAPIIVDDLTNNRFNQHAIETIKNDDFGVGEHLVNYSAVVISANEDVKAVAPEVIRRTVICRVNAGLTNTEVMKSNIVRMVQQKIGTAFYREYLRRMMKIVPKLIEELKNEESESAPDILNYSSKVIVDIITEYAEEVPDYIRELTLDNYFSEQVTGKHAIKVIQNAWRTSKKSFKVDKGNNELRYNAGAPYEADRIIKELPETLEAHKARDWVVMNLEEAKKFFGIEFKKGIF